MAETKVTRIKATDSTPRKSVSKPIKASKRPKKAPRSAPKNPILRGFYRLGVYFVGAWVELRQVRWPTRKATWSLTLAVILFSAFFVVIILLLDLVFKYLFELILK